MDKKIYFMKKALKEARKAYEKGEIPVGCVIVKEDRIISRGHNLREKKFLTISHAEIEAISKACKKLKSWRLEGCEIYITLEPCLMCAGAIKEARISKIFFGAYDKKNGFSLYLKNFFKNEEVLGGLMEEESKSILKDFFKVLRRGAGAA